MTYDYQFTDTLNNLGPRDRNCSTSSTRSPSVSSQSSTGVSRPVTPLDSARSRLYPQLTQRSAISPCTFSVEEFWSQKSPPESEYHSTPSSSRGSLEETRPLSDEYQSFLESAYSRPRTRTVTPATVRRALYRDSERMRIPFPGSSQRDSSSSTDSRPSFSSSDSASTYDEEFGGVPARHLLRNGADSKGNGLVFGDVDGRPDSPTTPPFRANTSRPESGSSFSTSSSPRSSVSQRIKTKKSYSHRGAMTLFKSLASSPNAESLRKFEDIEFDWAEQRRQALEERASQLEWEMKEVREASLKREVQMQEEVQTPAREDSTAVKETAHVRANSLELSPEALALRNEQNEAEARRFIFKDLVWVNRSYVSAHTKEAVPYPFAYDSIDIQTERHSHNLVKQLLCGRLSIHEDLSKKPPSYVLDLGCGDGTWILEATQSWRATRFYGLDLQKLHPPRQQLVADLGELADNVKFTYYNFLLDKLPYLDEKFDFVRMANLKWAIPEDKWDFILQEVHRVLRRGGCVEIIDDDFLLCPSFPNTLSGEQRTSCEMLESQFTDMLKSRGFSVNTGDHFIAEKLGRWFGAPHEDRFPLTISRSKTVSVDGHGRGQVQPILSSEGIPPKAAKLMGLGVDSPHDKHRSTGSTSTRSRSRSDSVSSYSSGVSGSSGRDVERSDDLVDDQADFVNDGNKRETYQPLGLELLPGRFIPFSPEDVSIHAMRNMQSILASKEAIRAHTLKKDPNLEVLEVKPVLSPDEKLQFDELSSEWNERQRAFDDAVWDFESVMLKRLNLPQRYFDTDDDNDDHHHKSFSPTSRLQPLRIVSGSSKLPKNGDGNLPSPTSVNLVAGFPDVVRLIRVSGGLK